MVTTFARALWQAQINSWIWGPRLEADHIRVYNLAVSAEHLLAEGDPTLDALRRYREFAISALEDGGPGWVPMVGGPVVFDPARDLSTAERTAIGAQFRDCLARATALSACE